jgi:hypothetical protein
VALTRREFLATLTGVFAAPALAQQRAEPFQSRVIFVQPPDFPSEALTDVALWDRPDFLDWWSPPQTEVNVACRVWPGKCTVFGLTPHSTTAFFDKGRLRSISLLFVDAGAWFGYVPDALAESVAATKGPEFLRLFAKVSADVDKGLIALGAKRQEVKLGGRGLLKHTARVSKHGTVASRLVTWPEQLVKLTIYRDEDGARNLLAPQRRTLKREDQARAFAALSRAEANGDRVIQEIPIQPQGDRAYCGMSALAMVLQHLGARIETEELAAGAGIRFGSTRNAKTREIYDGAAEAGGLRFERAQRFSYVQARASIDTGMPVVVFRHWSQERDFIHSTFAQRFREDPAAALPRADTNDRKLWPKRGAYAHASIVNGYNAARGEVIFTESWAEHVRNRRMRFEEMEGTSYLACYPHLV